MLDYTIFEGNVAVTRKHGSHKYPKDLAGRPEGEYEVTVITYAWSATEAEGCVFSSP